MLGKQHTSDGGNHRWLDIGVPEKWNRYICTSGVDSDVVERGVQPVGWFSSSGGGVVPNNNFYSFICAWNIHRAHDYWQEVIPLNMKYLSEVMLVWFVVNYSPRMRYCDRDVLGQANEEGIPVIIRWKLGHSILQVGAANFPKQRVHNSLVHTNTLDN
jgi:hypothetical protein